MKNLACLLFVLFVTGCASQHNVAALARSTRIATLKADIALLLLSKPERERFERGVRDLGGTLGSGLQRGEAGAYFPLSDDDTEALVITFRVDDQGRVVTLAVDGIVLTP